jgi:hypothetical protein
MLTFGAAGLGYLKPFLGKGAAGYSSWLPYVSNESNMGSGACSRPVGSVEPGAAPAKGPEVGTGPEKALAADEGAGRGVGADCFITCCFEDLEAEKKDNLAGLV